VVVNSGLDIGTAESKTDSLVNHLLTRALGFDGWPFGVRIKENYKLAINDKKVSASPDFVVDMGGITILVTEDKHLKNVSLPDYGEAQILAELLACGWENLDRSGSGKYIDQTIYAIRVISSYVTFYKAEIPKAYWKELRRGLPHKQSIEILRWPGKIQKNLV
ncbi:8177_t:CDS:2, partial [Funneliformis caledonium]